jgi:type IV pilus assembly protein PilN
MQQNNQLVTLKGTAQSNERVSELLRNLAYRSSWFSKPELVEIVAASVRLTPADQRRVANFTIRVHLLRASEAKAATESAEPGAVAPAAAKPGQR